MHELILITIMVSIAAASLFAMYWYDGDNGKYDTLFDAVKDVLPNTKYYYRVKIVTGRYGNVADVHVEIIEPVLNQVIGTLDLSDTWRYSSRSDVSSLKHYLKLKVKALAKEHELTQRIGEEEVVR